MTTATGEARLRLRDLLAQYGRIISASTPESRRLMLREVATHPNDYAGCELEVVRLIVGYPLTAEQITAFDELKSTVAWLSDLRDCSVEWRDVVPHANPAQGHSAALDKLEGDIAASLDLLVKA